MATKKRTFLTRADPATEEEALCGFRVGITELLQNPGLKEELRRIVLMTSSATQRHAASGRKRTGTLRQATESYNSRRTAERKLYWQKKQAQADKLMDTPPSVE